VASPAAVLAILVEANTRQADAAMAKTQAQLKATAATASASSATMSKRFSAAGKKMTTVGKSLNRHITLPALAVGAASVKMAVDFEDSMSKIENLVGSSQKQVDKWGKQILALAPKVGKSPQELADALYFITSSGIKASDAMNVLKITAKASAIGLGETETVADAVTSAMNAYAKSGLSAADATNTLANAVKLGKGEPEDLAKSIGRVIPIASKLGVPFQDVSAALASMTLQGLDAAEATTALRGIFSATFKPTTDANDALEKVGLSAEELRDSLDKKGTLATLQMLSTKLHGNVEAMGAVFPNIRGLVGAFNLTGDSADKNAKIFDEMSKKTRTVQVGFQHLSETDAFKLRQALAQLQASAVKIGTALLPVVNDVASVIGGLAKGLSSMPAFARDILIGAVVLGPAIRAFGGLATAIGGLAKVGRSAATALGLLAPAETAAAAGATSMVGPLFAVAAAGAAAAGAGVYIEKKWHPVGGLMTKELPDGLTVLAQNMHQIAKTSRKDLMIVANSADDGFGAAGKAVQGLKRRYGDFVTAGHQMSKGQREAWIDVALTARRNGDITSKELLQLTNAFTHNRKQWEDNMKKVANATGETTKKVKANVGDMGAKVSGTYKNMVEVSLGQFDFLTSKTNSLLKEMGIKQEIKFSATHAGGKLAGTVGHPRQKGGPIPGVGSGDKIPAMLEPGEFVMNKNAVAKHRGLLEAINFSDAPRFAAGGLAGLQPGISRLAKWAMGSLGLGISSGLRPGTGSFHNTGEAVDLVPPSMNATRRIFAAFKSQLEELFYDPWGGYDSGQMIGAIGGHMDHIHAAILGAGKGGPGGLMAKLPRVILNGPDGPLRDIGQANIDRVRAAAQRYLNKQSIAMPHVGGGAMSPGDIAALWTSVNGGLGDPNLMARIAMAESSGIPTAIGHDPGGTTGYGLWQITSGFHDDLIRKYGGPKGILNPKNNALAAASILRSEGVGAWAASGPWQKGGMIPLFGQGADFIAHRPMTIGVGDDGPERVAITPLGSGGVHQPDVQVSPPNVNVDVLIKGDIADYIDYAVSQAIEDEGSHGRQLGRMR
jgi:TP901 family phage tail tape measure protein